MSDDDKDVDIESDDEDLGSSASISGDSNRNTSFSQADKRAHHNALERKRRDHIKDSFSSLRDAVPSLHGEKASRAQILKKAAEYIAYMRRKNTTVQADIDDLKRQNKVLEEQIVRTLEKAKSSGITELDLNGTSLLDNSNHVKIESESVSSLDGMSD
jgi:Max protein